MSTNIHTNIHTNTETKTEKMEELVHTSARWLLHSSPTGPPVRLNRNLLLSYASSSMRLIIFMEHCGPEHPCTINETRLFRRYDAMMSRHNLLNNGVNRSVVSASIASHLLEVAKPIASTFDLEPDFEAEIVAKFIRNVKTRFST